MTRSWILRGTFSVLTGLLITAAASAATAPAGATKTQKSTVAAKRAAASAKRSAKARLAAKAAPAAKAPAAQGAAGMRVYLDPESGQFVDTPSDPNAALLEIDPMNNSDQGLTPVLMPDGSLLLDHQGRFAEFLVLKLDASGKPVLECVGDSKAGDAHTHVPAAKPVER